MVEPTKKNMFSVKVFAVLHIITPECTVTSNDVQGQGLNAIRKRNILTLKNSTTVVCHTGKFIIVITNDTRNSFDAE